MSGPAPFDLPTFPVEFLDRCRSLVRKRTVSRSQHQRARLALLFHEAPASSNVAAGAVVDLHPNSVRLWRHRWACGDFSLVEQPGRGRKPVFPPRDQAIVKAIACEAVCQTKLPLSRLSTADLAARAATTLRRPISPSTVWRILDADAIKPWQYEHWIFPRDPHFAEKAGRILDLYAGSWEGKPLGRRDYIISSDEKTSIQARIRCHKTLPTGPKRPRRVESEYGRGGALQYLAAWDVRRGRVMGRCEAHTGIESFGRLVEQLMRSEPYRSANRVFWVVDNGSSHRGQTAVRRLRKAHRKAVLVHTPVHASWLNQVEIYFSIIQRKVLTPNDFASLDEVEQRLLLYEELSNREPRPFDWKFDRAALQAFLKRLEAKRVVLPWASAS